MNDTKARTTLRGLMGLDMTPATLSNATLVLIDYQNTYTTGVLELHGWQAALDSAAGLLDRARKAGTKIIHVQHDGGAGSPYDLTKDIGQIHRRVAPAKGEPVVTKRAPNAFFQTDLAERIDEAGNKNVIIAGFMTHMCVTFTSEGAFLHGNHVTVPADACATRAIRTDAAAVSAEQLHQAALVTIGDIYGVVVPSARSIT